MDKFQRFFTDVVRLSVQAASLTYVILTTTECVLTTVNVMFD